MQNQFLLPFALVLAAIVGVPPSLADNLFAPVAGAIGETKPIVDLRLRTETVDQVGIAQNAEAVTLRARLGFETGKAWNTSFAAEVDLITPLGSRYNSTVNGKTAYPVVADPESYELNRLQLTNTAIPQTTVTLGRQRLNLDDQRFVGSVGWRQNDQTVDAVRVVNKGLTNLTLDFSYASRVNRVFGRDSPVGTYEGDNWLVNASYQTKLGKLTTFGYLLDFRQSTRDSSQTLGLRWNGEKLVDKVKLTYSASYAQQRDRGRNPLSYAADYLAFEATGTYRQWSLGLGTETLEGNGVRGFATPLATLHKFQGWADKFLTTPANGIVDNYATLGFATKGVAALETLSVQAVWHEYDSDRLSLDYGSELDLQAQAKWRRFNGTLKYATYQARQFATDTDKFWLQVDYIW
jgi:hypothetical protein